MKKLFERKWAKIFTGILIALGSILIVLYIVERMQPNAYKKLLDDTLVVVKQTTPDVVYESEAKNGKSLILYVPVDEKGNPVEEIYKAMVDFKSQQYNQPIIKDSVTIIYAKQDTSLPNVNIYHITQDDYRYSQGQYVKNTSRIVNTMFQKDGKILTLWDMMNSAQFESEVFAEELKLAVRKSALDVDVKVKLLRLITKDTVDTFKMIYTPEELRFQLVLPDEQPYYIAVDPIKLVPYLNVGYIYESYRNRYSEVIEQADTQQLTQQQKFAKNLQQQLSKHEIGMKIALTFDDGPKSGLTERLLDILAKHDAKATFYILGRNISGNEEILKRQLAQGHELGNHSWTHDNLTTVSEEQLNYEINHTQEVIKNIVGEMPKTLRAPYGLYNAQVAQVANIPLVNWNVDSHDWNYRDARSSVNSVLSDVSPGAIVLMHDVHVESIEAAEEIIIKLKQKGYQFVTVSELIGEQNLFPHMVYFGHDDVKSAE